MVALDCGSHLKRIDLDLHGKTNYMPTPQGIRRSYPTPTHRSDDPQHSTKRQHGKDTFGPGSGNSSVVSFLLCSLQVQLFCSSNTITRSYQLGQWDLPSTPLWLLSRHFAVLPSSHLFPRDYLNLNGIGLLPISGLLAMWDRINKSMIQTATARTNSIRTQDIASAVSGTAKIRVLSSPFAGSGSVFWLLRFYFLFFSYCIQSFIYTTKLDVDVVKSSNIAELFAMHPSSIRSQQQQATYLQQEKQNQAQQQSTN